MRRLLSVIFMYGGAAAAQKACDALKRAKDDANYHKGLTDEEIRISKLRKRDQEAAEATINVAGTVAIVITVFAGFATGWSWGWLGYVVLFAALWLVLWLFSTIW